MRVRTFWNHELAPNERVLAASLSDGRAVGAVIATEGGAFGIVPITAPEIIDPGDDAALEAHAAAVASAVRCCREALNENERSKREANR